MENEERQMLKELREEYDNAMFVLCATEESLPFVDFLKNKKKQLLSVAGLMDAIVLLAEEEEKEY